MGYENIKGTPFDYCDDKVVVYFEVADKRKASSVIKASKLVNEVEESDFGFSIKIAIQQIPEMIQYFTKENIAIYAVIPQK